jgi:hypothetical protein
MTSTCPTAVDGPVCPIGVGGARRGPPGPLSRLWGYLGRLADLSGLEYVARAQLVDVRLRPERPRRRGTGLAHCRRTLKTATRGRPFAIHTASADETPRISDELYRQNDIAHETNQTNSTTCATESRKQAFGAVLSLWLAVRSAACKDMSAPPGYVLFNASYRLLTMKSATSLFLRALGLVAIMFFMVVQVNAQTVTSNGATISDGDIFPTSVDGTDLGDKLVMLETSSSVYRFTNTDAGSVMVTGIEFAAANALIASGLTMSYSAVLPLMMPPGANLDVTVAFDPQDGGTHTDNVEFVYTGGAGSPYFFAVEGEGLLDYGDFNSGDAALAVMGARHVATGIRLGTLRDAEADVTAGFDDANGIDDEDGVLAPVKLVEGETSSLVLTVDQAGFASAFVDSNNDAGPGAGDIDATLFEDVPVVAGQNVVSFVVPTITGPSSVRARVRVCGAIDDCDTSTGLAADGEVEDFIVTTATTAGTAPVTLTMFSSEVNVDLSGTDMVITDENGNTIIALPLANVDDLTITGTSADESVSIDPDVIDAMTNMLATVNLGLGTDSMTILPGAAAATFVTHEFTNANDGNVWVDGANIVYTGLDPISDLVVAGHRTFTFSDGAETITMSPDGDGALANGTTHIDSDLAEMVSFVNPTASLTINTDDGIGGGIDIVTIGELDSPVAGTFASITVNAFDGNDQVSIAPGAGYTVSTDGGVGTDVFLVDLSGGASIASFVAIGGAGTVTFTGHGDITFSNYESFGPADLELEINKSLIYTGDDLSGNTVLTLTITNNGPAPAVAGAVVDLDGLLVDNPSLSASAALILPALAAGASTTIDITGFVTNINPATYDISVTFGGDVFTSNNNVALATEPGFAFPPKTHINAAHYMTQTSDIGAVTSDPYDKLIVGLFQGSPGIDGAVWCKITHPITRAANDGVVGDVDRVADILFPAPISATDAAVVAGTSTDYFGDRWRPCAKGLPFPLHVNDMFEDDNGTPMNEADDILWLMTWGSAGLYKSVDFGESWEAASPDATCTTIPTNCLANGNGGNGAWTNVYAMTKDLDGFLYISVNDGYVFRSLNGGTSWQQVGSLPEVDADTPWSLVADPDDAGTIYAGTFGRGVYFSDDYGFNWSFLGGTAENNVLLGNPDGDLDNPDDLFAGHIFDMEIAQNTVPSSEVLFAATASGIWGMELDGAREWKFYGPTVTLDDASEVIPEIRSLALSGDNDLVDGPDFLIAGSWGFGGFAIADPVNAVPSTTAAMEITLRGEQITFVAVAPTSGTVFFGTSTGDNVTVSLTAASATANETDISTEIPDGFALEQNYPNPFNPVTTIQFALPESGNVRLAVYDVLGREVAVLVDKAMTAGQHGVQFNAANLTSGTYIYRLSTDKGSFTKQLSLLK